MAPGVNDGGPNTLMLNQYRQAGQGLGIVTMYHDDLRVGTSYEAVAR